MALRGMHADGVAQHVQGGGHLRRDRRIGGMCGAGNHHGQAAGEGGQGKAYRLGLIVAFQSCACCPFPCIHRQPFMIRR